jgi:mannosyltransferase OCH1-like enzyme
MNKIMISNYISNIMTPDIIQKTQNELIKNKFMSKKLSILLKIPYPIKNYYNTIIPLTIYQTWHTKNLPPSMKKTVDTIIKNNPIFDYQLFDDNDCRNFILNNFDINVLNAFDSLKPGAYKADLWRYCILYIKGGIYLDIKYEPVNDFKFINLTEKEHWVLDLDKTGIYNALIVSKPHNKILLKAINNIVYNVKNKFYGTSPLSPTGPLMLANFFSKNEKESFDMYHDIYRSVQNRFIFLNNYLVFKSFDSYLIEHDKFKKTKHYSELWRNKSIYN